MHRLTNIFAVTILLWLIYYINPFLFLTILGTWVCVYPSFVRQEHTLLQLLLKSCEISESVYSLFKVCQWLKRYSSDF